ncbi:MAG: 5-deoxy-glucuronate isomerase [Chloroflexi bacterium]|nr:5-deoxy-glucuronate isomerase [Chloroflexota bacterium]
MSTLNKPILSRLLSLTPSSGYQPVFQPGQLGICWLGLDLLRLADGESWQEALGDQEASLVILGGCCAISVNSDKAGHWDKLGSREDIFGGPATAVYAPRRSVVHVTAKSKLELAIAKAPCEANLPPALVKPGDVKVVSSGTANWRREVRLVIPPGSPISQRLIIGETVNPPGNWSGIPPHKHDEMKNGMENILEEFYLFKTRPADGHAVQMVYDDEQRQAHVVGNDAVMVFLGGYHPTVALPGTTVCYLWALSGDSKTYNFTVDPCFSGLGAT